MKTLFVVRHAKSSWSDPGLADIERPLNKRGERDAPLMGERLADRLVEVDRIVSSPAARALSTAEAIAAEIDYPYDQIVIDDGLYHADAFEILQIVESFEEYLDSVMIFGHNPGFTSFVNRFSPYTIDNVPTSSVAEIRFDLELWSGISEAEPVEFEFDFPKSRR